MIVILLLGGDVGLDGLTGLVSGELLLPPPQPAINIAADVAINSLFIMIYSQIVVFLHPLLALILVMNDLILDLVNGHTCYNR